MKRSLPRNRRVAAICGGSAAAIAGSTAALQHLQPAGLSAGLEGFVIGLCATLCFGAIIMFRKDKACE